MKLTTSQIDQLFTFTRQHYVEWYDLQSELVDHLANAIETDWQENPTLSFEAALNIEFKKFGVFGFMDVVEKRQAALSKKYNSIVWKHFKDFFSVPKIILTVAMTLAMFLILKISAVKEYIFLGFYLLMIIGMFYEIYKGYQTRKNKKQSGEKRWLFEEIISHYGNFAGIIILPFNMITQLFNHSDRLFSNDYWLIGLSFFLVSFGLFLFIIFKIIPSKAESYLLATYPEYKLEKL